MDFADYIALLRRRWWLVALGLVVALSGAALATFLQTPKYRTSTRLLVSAAASGSVDEITKRQLASQRAIAFAQYASTGPAVSAVREAAGVTSSVRVSATADANSPFLVITVSGSEAEDVAAVANAYVSTLPSVVQRLDQNAPGVDEPKLSVLEAAGVPAKPYSPRAVTNFAVGAALGLLLGLAAAILRESLDTTVRKSEDVEQLTDLPLLGVVSKEYGDERLIAFTRPRSRRTEAYRTVRTNLEFTSATGMPRSVVVTSAAPGEGKTTLAANLAVIASQAGLNVLLVDADLRKPTVSRLFELPEGLGLTDALLGHDVTSLLRATGQGQLHVLPSGSKVSNPSELLGSTRMVELLDYLESRFDLVLIDTAPVLPVTDALVVGVNGGGVILVARLAETTRNSLKQTLKLLRNVNANLLGVVANGAVEEDDKRYGYGYGYLSRAAQDSPAGER